MSTLLHRLPHDPLRPPEAPGLGRGFGFAVAAHLLLIVALSFGVHWHTHTEPAFEAELWSAVPVAAAPKLQEPTPPPQPVVKPPPEPPKPSAEVLQAQQDAEIAIAKQREKLKKQQDDQAAADKLREQQRKQQEQQQADEKRQQALDQQKLAQQKKAVKDAAAKQEAQRKEFLRRIQGMAGSTGDENATGSAARNAGPSASYAGRIKARVKPNIVGYIAGATNPQAEVELHMAPDGTIISRRMMQASGDDDWDRAVLRAIDKTQVLPRDDDGSVPSVIVIVFKPRE